jgi:tetratricopeptide (TPR) repeat protein
MVLIIIGMACYANTFHVPFILDDEGSIQLHTPVHGLANYFENWSGYRYLPNRAFGYLTFAINYEFGGLNLPGFHLVNLAIHIGNALLIYALVQLLFRTPFCRHSDKAPPNARMFAFAIALLFVCHPLQSQAVTYIVQRLTSLTTLLYLASLACYLRWRLPQTDDSPPSRKRYIWYLLSLAAVVLAMKTKEISFTLPVMILLCEVSFFGWPSRKLLARLSPLLLTIAIIPVTTYRHVMPAMQTAASGGSLLSDVHNPAYNLVRITRWEYLYTQFSVIITYLRLLFFPVNLNLDYDYPINRTFMEPRPLVSLVFLMLVIMLALHLFRISGQRERQRAQGAEDAGIAAPPLLRLASFGIFWFFITLSVESSIVTLQDVIYEHRTYLPSFGFFLSVTALATLGLNRFHQRLPWLRQLAFISVACIVVILSVATYARNHVWRDWLSLWSDNVAKSPNKPRPHNILGIGYFYAGIYDQAIREYQEAIRLKPDFIEPYYNLALVHAAKNEHKEAIIMYLKVLGMSAFDATQHARAYNEIGISYAELGNRDQAVISFATAVRYEPESIEFLNNYAFALANAGSIDAAVRQYQKVLQLAPGNSFAMQALQELRSHDKRDGS